MPTTDDDQERAPRWWNRRRHQDRRPFLEARMRIKAAIRAWFLERGYIEVETACLQISPGNETHLHAFATEFITPAATRHPLYLHTSPEFACKKLLAAGETKIFTFSPVFRNRERTFLHHPEFTMLEWYEVDVHYTALMGHCHEILKVAAEATGLAPWRFRDVSADPGLEPERVKVADAFACHAGIDLMASIMNGMPERRCLAEAAIAQGIRVAEDDTWSDIFSRIMVACIEPHLGNGRPTILDAYPICEAALARPAPRDGNVAERFELYCCGVELANAFGELTDPTAQRRRFEADMAEKERLYGARYPLDDDFLAALAHMPAASGCALGFDRLVMLATGAQRVDQTIWTPLPEF
ncbi:MAG: EF-P lysine aminoacylase EpmA [Pseudomonadota bacterium]